MARTKNFADVIRAKIAADPELASAIEDESFSADIAQKVYDLRIAARLTQKQLAQLIGTQQSVISRALRRGNPTVIAAAIANSRKFLAAIREGLNEEEKEIGPPRAQLIRRAVQKAVASDD